MEIGSRYSGFYQHNDFNYSKSRGFEKTYFSIEVTEFDGHKFSGWIEDDVLTGGMEGRGTVSGAIYSNGIMFVKSMPYLGLYYRDASGKYFLKVDKTRRHKPIYYDGIELGNDRFTGTWRFKYGILASIMIWLNGMKPGGTWEMSKVNNT